MITFTLPSNPNITLVDTNDWDDTYITLVFMYHPIHQEFYILYKQEIDITHSVYVHETHKICISSSTHTPRYILNLEELAITTRIVVHAEDYNDDPILLLKPEIDYILSVFNQYKAIQLLKGDIP